MELMAIFREFAQMAAPAAVAAVWQGMVLAVGLAVSLRFMPRLSPADRFRVWAAGLLALAMLPFLPWLSSLGIGTSVVPGVGAAAAPKAWLDFDLRWTLVIAGAWLAASAWRLADLAVHGLRLRRLWKRAEPIGFDGSRIEVCTTRDLDRPSVIGFFRPRILIPVWLLERLTERELEQVVLHEVEHLRRRDDWVNLAQKLALAVFPLNPALWWMERRMCREREMACDDAVVRTTEKPRDYAACLASLAERGLERRLARGAAALSLGAWHRRPELVERVHRILKRGPGLSPAAARGLLAVVGCGLVLGSVEFARCPQLVAFEGPPVAAAQDMADSGALSGYKMVNAMARVPSRAALAAMRPVPTAARVHGSPALATEKNREDRALKILSAQRGAVTVWPDEVNTAEAAQPYQAPVQQLVVFTTFEQIQTADAAQPASENQAQSQPVVARQFAVTQLILRVYPNPVSRQAGANEASTENAGAGTAGAGNASSNSASSRSRYGSGLVPVQQVVPLRDGLLVFQL
jgi:Zn-dependent protease with chaperone function